MKKELPTKTEEYLKILFENAPDAIYVNDLRGIFVDGNETAEKLTGYKRHELIGKSFLKLKLLPTNQIPKAAALLAKNAIGKGTGPDEFTLNKKDGSQIQVEIRAYPVKIGKKAYILGIARDITERKQAEEVLKESEEKLSRAFHSNPHPMSIVTLEEGHYLDVNDSYVQTFGFSREELLGITTVEVGILKDDSARRKILQLQKEERALKNLEVEFYTRSRQKVDALLSSDKMEIGGQACLLSVITDITEHKRMQEEIQTLSGLLPICAWCKKLRDDEGYWKSVEQYIGERTKAEFTHGVCPECQSKFFREKNIDTRVT